MYPLALPAKGRPYRRLAEGSLVWTRFLAIDTMPGLSPLTKGSSVKSWKTPDAANMPKLISPLKVMTSGTRFLTRRVRKSVWASAELLMFTLMSGFSFSNCATMALNWSAASNLNWKKSRVTWPESAEPQPAMATTVSRARSEATPLRTQVVIRPSPDPSLLPISFIFGSFTIRTGNNDLDDSADQHRGQGYFIPSPGEFLSLRK